MRREQQCFFKIDNGQGRCIAHCSHAKNGTDCTGERGPTLDGPCHLEVKITGKCVELPESVDIVHNHDAGTWTRSDQTVYQPDINTDCLWGRSKGGR